MFSVKICAVFFEARPSSCLYGRGWLAQQSVDRCSEREVSAFHYMHSIDIFEGSITEATNGCISVCTAVVAAIPASAGDTVINQSQDRSKAKKTFRWPIFYPIVPRNGEKTVVGGRRHPWPRGHFSLGEPRFRNLNLTIDGSISQATNECNICVVGDSRECLVMLAVTNQSQPLTAV